MASKSKAEEVRISQLPDPLICDILTRIPTKYSVRISVLSTRWRNLWRCVPGLDLDSRTFSNFDVFVSFADMFFDMQRELCTHKLCLSIEPRKGKDAVTFRKIQHLKIGILGSSFKLEEIPLLPLSLYTCETLVHLELHQVVLVDAESFHLPCLKFMKLNYIRYHNEAALEKLVSCSPVLEDFWIMTYWDDETEVLHLSSQSLKRIAINHQHTLVVVDAPRLQRLRTRFNSTKNYKIVSSGFPPELDIHFGAMHDGSDPNKVVIHDIFTEISEVSDLSIGSHNWKYIFPYSGPLVQFCYLSRLKAIFSASDLELLPTLLECCPKLESLILELYEQPKMMFSTLPPCLVSSLKFMQLISCVEEYHDGELNLVRYFLKSSKILEKLSVRFSKIKSSRGILKEQVVAMPICSSTCQVLVL